VRASYFEDLGTLVVGGVDPEAVHREIEAELQGRPAPAPQVTASAAGPTPTFPPPEPRVQTIQLDDSRAYRVRKVVIDPGHGGKDGGACGRNGHFCEKQATLDIGRTVAELLKREPDLEVLLTRDKDKFVSLQKRADYANRHRADLFVSIHCNANPRSTARGTETYVYSSRATGNAGDLAARENAGGDFMDFTLADLMHNDFRSRSYYLAEKVDGRIRDRMGQKILRIEQAPFYVLARVRMPSILIETAFISNPSEEQKLKDPDWRSRMARSIADGILEYRDNVEEAFDRKKERETASRE
jgi:N-acetylmuramoyl-L-alanine amidase